MELRSNLSLLCECAYYFCLIGRHFHAFARQVLFYKTKNTRETAPIQRRSPGVKIFYLDYNLNTFHLLIKAVFVISAATYLFDVCFLVINVSDYADRCAVIAIGYFYSCPFGACMHHLAVADVHGYMVNAASVSIEEEVSGLCI